MDALEKAKTSDPEQPKLAEKNKHFDQETGIVIPSKDGIQLFPQPIAGDSLDPLNWSGVQKHTILAIVMALSVQPRRQFYRTSTDVLLVQILHVHLRHDHDRPILSRSSRKIQRNLRPG